MEIDVLYDPLGGHYAKPQGLDIVNERGEKPLPFDELEQLNQPGLKVFHIPEIDFRSHDLLFSGVLIKLKQWSDQHLDHLPIIILINAKEGDVNSAREPLLFTKKALDSIDNEIRSNLGVNKVLTPDAVRGDYETLEKAVLNKAWPSLEKVKGMFLFVLDEKGAKRDRYVDGHVSLKGRMMFTNSPKGRPESAFRVINNPVRDFDEIQSLVKAGYMVRTRADANTHEARENSYERFEKAKASGAQVISTDFYIPSQLFDSDFQIKFSDGRYERIQLEL